MVVSVQEVYEKNPQPLRKLLCAITDSALDGPEEVARSARMPRLCDVAVIDGKPAQLVHLELRQCYENPRIWDVVVKYEELDGEVVEFTEFSKIGIATRDGLVDIPLPPGRFIKTVPNDDGTMRMAVSVDKPDEERGAV